ncbi:D-serine ammonia-lyase [Hahella chejuensis KCTC 2396]|uniref:Probable D-serine dehydratase n=1 Tax=Hahella chejuensis (strain KCTC 2396) TaxID=349521 RepID=SDHD_HAHCH|nr:D-serine ammonia-lyase [Hahella chejuensis]Q2SHX7.1 RecName: Full=Probable D-serine dehydratase; AltName: Full=D-serine deaminase; Short=DSD [Hahella chejuensis KCTC 2396]ABC29747.1 D-serine ammonia-lyase [Hahella chejuensis KCTC 2396]
MNPLSIAQDELKAIQSSQPIVWLNRNYQNPASAPATPNVDALYAAEARLKRFAPLLQRLFPELEPSHGLIESSLIQADRLNNRINPVGGLLFLKADHDLPVAGSVKARGGIHEVLCFAESLALTHGVLKDVDSDYCTLASQSARDLFSKHTITVGSTGNLGLSIGVIGSALGFKTVVHMSSDAKEWKMERLRKRGVRVVEHDADYGAALEAGRLETIADPCGYFVDDERSPNLFMGYAVAAKRLQAQLEALNIKVDADHPLFVYLPAGVGGAPGGITYGLKHIFNDHVHCFFAEPVQSPCMLLGMAGAPGAAPTSIYELDLKNRTDADGLAVGAASQWVCDATRNLLSGVYTATDEQLYQQLYLLKDLENIEVEPSAAIGCLGPAMLTSEAGQKYLDSHRLSHRMENSVHIPWLTGGSFVPDEEYQRYLAKAVNVST